VRRAHDLADLKGRGLVRTAHPTIKFGQEKMCYHSINYGNEKRFFPVDLPGYD
jgi:hypothetical protein